MRIRSLLALTALLTALAVSAPVQAQTYAFATDDGYTNMRAGPGTRYPVVARIHPGSRVYVLGCISDHSWCEGVVQGVQGWIHARRLEFLYAGRRVLVPNYYAYFGAPIISFHFDDYDDDYYDWRPRHRRPHWRPPHHNPPNDGEYTNWKPGNLGGGGQVIGGGGGAVGAGPGVSGGGSGGMPGGGGGGEPFIPPSGGGFDGGGGGFGNGGGGFGGGCPPGISPC